MEPKLVLPRSNSTFWVDENTGDKYDRPTSILSAINKPALVPWAANQEREACVEAACILYFEAIRSPDWASTVLSNRDAFVSALMDRLGKAKAHQKEMKLAQDIGSLVHARIENKLLAMVGKPAKALPPVTYTRDQLDAADWATMAFDDLMKKMHVVPERIEERLYSTQFFICGTPDLLAKVDGKTTIVDWKSGKGGVYAEHPLQLACYAKLAIERDWVTDWPAGLIVGLPKSMDRTEPKVKYIPPEEMPGLWQRFLAVRDVARYLQDWEAERKIARAA